MGIDVPISQICVRRKGSNVPFLTGFACDAAGFVWLALAVAPAGSYPHLLGPLLLADAGSGLAVPSTVSASLRAVPVPQVGLASGIGSTFRKAGGVFGVATAAAVVASADSYLSPEDLVAGLRPALLALAGLAATGLLAALAVRRGPARTPWQRMRDPARRSGPSARRSSGTSPPPADTAGTPTRTSSARHTTGSPAAASPARGLPPP